jgi:hypothetical protein
MNRKKGQKSGSNHSGQLPDGVAEAVVAVEDVVVVVVIVVMKDVKPLTVFIHHQLHYLVFPKSSNHNRKPPLRISVLPN